MSILCIGMICLKRKGIWNYIRQILIVVLLFAMNLRIMVYSNDVEKRQLDIDVLFVIDNSMSMLAEDYNGDGRRIDAVKSDCEYIMDKLTGARFSVIEFGNYANRLAPYTSDITAIQTAINSLEGQTQYYATGTSLNLPYETVKEVLEKNRENNPDRTQVLFFFSDGEITTKNEKLDSYASAADYIDGGAVLGYGTTEGGRMKVHSYEGDYGDPFYMQTRDKSGRLVDAISYIDESNLKQIAKDLELNYYLAENQDAVRDMIIDLTNYLNEMATSEHLGDEGYSETYYWFAIPMVGLLIYDLIYYKRRLRG
ncbi:MAG: VWA domain-containing protein [Clostridiales bacterium]|nr:VWA domain-containing protein [Clostridiales bacterium]